VATKTITLTEEAYQRLRAMRRDDESFSDVVLRLTDSEQDIMKGFGSWADTDLREETEAARNEFDEDFETNLDDETVPLGDALSELAVDADVDAVDAVRDVREET
jgi:predicted CopG family antitoxin